MIRGIDIPLSDEFLAGKKSKEEIVEWASGLQKMVHDLIEDNISDVRKDNNIHVDIQLFVYRMPKGYARVALEHALKQGITDALSEHNKEIMSISCGYNFFSRVRHASIEVF